MSWKFLEKAPRLGDVLMYDSNMIVVVIKRRRLAPAKIPDVDVLWLLGHTDAKVTTHYGGFDSWKGWKKLSVPRRRIRT